MSDSAQHSVEPSVVMTKSGSQTYKVTTYLWGSASNRIYYSSLLTATEPSQELPRDAVYDLYFDPWLDANNSGGGMMPGRVYNAGIMTDGAGSTNNAIGVWYSDTQGASWTSPIKAATETSSNYFLDAPRLAVSHAPNASQGYVYVAYTRIHLCTGCTDRQLIVARSTNGGQTWTSSQVVANTFLGGSQVAVSPINGDVYAIWPDFSSPNRIRMAKSTDFGLTWSATETAATATYDFLGGSDDDGRLVNQVLAITIPMARYNSVSNRIEVVWHERRAALPSKATDVFFTSKTSSGWQPKLKLNDSTTEDHFQPALDFDESGNALVAWFAQNVTYRVRGQKLTSTGSKTGTNFNLDSCYGNASNYPNSHFMGDYHAVRSRPSGSTESRWVTAAVKRPNPGPGLYADIWLLFDN